MNLSRAKSCRKNLPEHPRGLLKCRSRDVAWSNRRQRSKKRLFRCLPAPADENIPLRLERTFPLITL